MNHRSLQHRLQAQIRRELPLYLSHWTTRHQGIVPDWLHDPASCSPETLQHELLELSRVMQRTRVVFKILEHAPALQQNISLEVFLYLIAQNPEKLVEVRQVIIDNMLSLYDFMAQHIAGNQEIRVFFPQTNRNRLLQLLHELDTSEQYGRIWRIFSVRHQGRDRAKLQLSGVDVLNLERNKLNLYLLELTWQDLLERSAGGVMGFINYLNRNGYAYDVRPNRNFLDAARPATDFVVRILYASKLDLDFVEAFIRIPHNQIHPVNQKNLRRNLPAWGVRPEPETSPLPQETAPSRSLDELVSEYNQAFERMIVEARQEHTRILASF